MEVQVVTDEVDFYLLSTPFVCPLVLVVDATEVGDNDRDGQSDHQHTAQGADGAEDLPGNRLWHHVSVSGEERGEKSLDKVLEEIKYIERGTEEEEKHNRLNVSNTVKVCSAEVKLCSIMSQTRSVCWEGHLKPVSIFVIHKYDYFKATVL